MLALAAFRLWKLIADDAILDRPRDFVLDRLARGGREARGVYWDMFLTCPWCLGFWIAIFWWAGYQLWPSGTAIVAVPFALSAVVGYLGVGIDRLED